MLMMTSLEKFTVRNNDGAVIVSPHYGIEDLDRLNSPLLPLCDDVITYVERFENEYQNTAGEVLQRSGQRQTSRYSDRTDQMRQKRSSEYRRSA